MRTYKAVKPKAAQRARMRHVARLRAEGLSLRQTAMQVGVSYQTVLRDLRQWDTEQAKVSHLPVTKLPPGGGNVTPGCDSGDAQIVPLRRSS
jgi:hypothetical protein